MRGTVDPEGKRDGEELGGVEGEEAMIRVYCLRKESIFDKRKKANKKAHTTPFLVSPLVHSLSVSVSPPALCLMLRIICKFSDTAPASWLLPHFMP